MLLTQYELFCMSDCHPRTSRAGEINFIQSHAYYHVKIHIFSFETSFKAKPVYTIMAALLKLTSAIYRKSLARMEYSVLRRSGEHYRRTD